MTKDSNETDVGKGEIGRSVTLPVLDSKQSSTRSGAPKMGRTKTARYRAAVLTLVNVLMIAHLIQWLIMGMTISPIEPSESMETLEVGVVNAGAIFFLVAIISTILFGRFFCGWLCHVVALQDLCAYIMTSMGIRPKPFRSRLLVYFPFFLGMYMFVWPSFKRLVLFPVLESASIDWPAWLRPVEPINQWSTALVVDDFWATMPPWYIAVPFLFICGFAAVYFLGAKGFCTYGCPYAAFFKPLDKVAPVRIHVNDDCRQCGYCTSACTSNVRVSEEVRDFGMVVDPGCMKTLDCISACPNDALSLGIGKPALFAKPTSPETYKDAKAKRKRRFDMKLWEELFASVLFLWFFFATRGAYDAVPMLMAGGLASIGVMLVMMSLKLFHEPNVRLYKYKFRAMGKIKPAGYLLLLVGIGFVVASVWSGQARLLRWKGDVLYAGTDVPTSVLMRPEYRPNEEQLKNAQSAINAYRKADSFDKGGLGWKLNAEHRLRLSYFLATMGQYDEALLELERVIEEGNPTDQLVIQAGQLSILADNTNPPEGMPNGEIAAYARTRLLALYTRALDAHPGLHAIRTELARSAYAISDLEKADSYWETTEFEDDASYYLAQAGYTSFAGDMPKTLELYKKTAELAMELEQPAGMLIDIARAALQYRFTDYALEIAQQAIDHPSATALTWLAAGEIANATNNGELGTERALHALTLPGIDHRPMVKARAAGVLAKPGNTDQAREMLIEAAEQASDPFEVLFVTQGMVRAGATLNDSVLLNRGIEMLDANVEAHPDLYLIRYDYAILLYSIGMAEEATNQMIRAAELDAQNPLIAARVVDLHRMSGNLEEQQRWEQEVRDRQAALANTKAP
jgi:polyferredoxin